MLCRSTLLAFSLIDLVTGIEERPSEMRIKEALALGDIDYFVVACPKDNTMYRDAVKTSGNEGKIEVKDVIELVDEAL